MDTAEKYEAKIASLKEELESVAKEVSVATSKRDQALSALHNAEEELIDVKEQIKNVNQDLFESKNAFTSQERDQSSRLESANDVYLQKRAEVEGLNKIKSDLIVDIETLENKKEKSQEVEKEVQKNNAALNKVLKDIEYKKNELEKLDREHVEKDRQIRAREEEVALGEKQLLESQQVFALARKKFSFYARKFVKMYRKIFNTELPSELVELISELK